MNKLLFTLLLITKSLLVAQSTNNELKLLISARVDTTSEDVNSILLLYENYFNSNPDSIYDNPYWNKAEKKFYNDFDYSRASIFQGGFTAKDLFSYFSPFVMSVEPIDNKYQIRVLYSSPTTTPAYAGSKVWCIHKLNAIKENENWVLENVLIEQTKQWNSINYGLIEYVFPPSHNFKHIEAKEAQKFCNHILDRFNPNHNTPFKYYITNNPDDMGILENFDYYFVGITTGKAREGMILTSTGNENYPHEFIHKLIPQNRNRSYLIEEGLAVYLGTRENYEEYSKILNQLAHDVKQNRDIINFKSVISQSKKYNGYQTAYPAGAVICELIDRTKGDQGLLELMNADTSNFDKIMLVVSKITGLNKLEIEEEWYEIILEYYQ